MRKSILEFGNELHMVVSTHEGILGVDKFLAPTASFSGKWPPIFQFRPYSIIHSQIRASAWTNVPKWAFRGVTRKSWTSVTYPKIWFYIESFNLNLLIFGRFTGSCTKSCNLRFRWNRNSIFKMLIPPCLVDLSYWLCPLFFSSAKRDVFPTSIFASVEKLDDLSKATSRLYERRRSSKCDFLGAKSLESLKNDVKKGQTSPKGNSRRFRLESSDCR